MQNINIPTRTLGRISLGLSTPTTFELQLLEVAVKGKKAFESYLNKESPSYGIDEQVMGLEILQEIKLWEKDGNRNLLMERARDQVVRVKDNKSLHTRALVIYRDFLRLSLAQSRSCVSTEPLSSQCRTRESTELTSSMERFSRDKEYNSSSQVQTLDEKLDRMLPIELPEAVDEESSSYVNSCSKTQGEPSGSSCEIQSILGAPSCEEISIFDKPKEADEGVITSGARFFEKLLITDDFEGRDSIFSRGGNNSHWSKVCSNMTSVARDEECFSWDVSSVKIDLCNDQTQKALGDFPAKDFKYPIQWTIDGITHEARNLSKLRSEHNIVLEGIFKKRFKCHTWRTYYGFFFNTGVMIYFKKDVFKKAVDFRKSTVTIPKVKQLMLIINDLHVSSRVTNWQLKFESAKHLSTWCKTIVTFSKGQKTEIDGIRQSVGSPMNLVSKQI